MKTKLSVALVICMLMLSNSAIATNKSTPQDKKTETLTGVFEGYDKEDGYSFLYKDEEGNDRVIYFEKISEEALKAFNLKSETMVGKTFVITYEIKEYDEEDDDGNIETYEEKIILELKKA